jgi:uncharacterized OB-fold protein
VSGFPVVLRDEASRAFFDAAARAELLMNTCTGCRTVHGQEVRTCHVCGSDALEGHPVSGAASLVSWVVVHHAPVPALAEAVPYTSAIVELDEGPWQIVRLVDVAEPHVGMRLTAQFVRPEGGEALPVFGRAS